MDLSADVLFTRHALRKNECLSVVLDVSADK